jgi:putative restriction endonuclease
MNGDGDGMTPVADVLNRFESIRRFGRGEKQAPHKPLLLLYALSRLKNEQIERIDFNDAEEAVNPLIRIYGPFKSKSTVAYPFARLANDKNRLWTVEDHTTNKSGDLNISEARNRHLKAGFCPDVLQTLKDRPEIIDAAVIRLLEKNFPPSLHPDILEAFGLFLGEYAAKAVERRKRDAGFRPKVLTAYFEQCCICKYDAKMHGAPIGLEAAHIKMHSAGGPDDVTNGLALCAMHHKLFDMGALTVDTALNIHVSETLVGDWGRKISDQYHEKPILRPRKDTSFPREAYLDWHNRQIFKGTIP